MALLEGIQGSKRSCRYCGNCPTICDARKRSYEARWRSYPRKNAMSSRASGQHHRTMTTKSRAGWMRLTRSRRSRTRCSPKFSGIRRARTTHGSRRSRASPPVGGPGTSIPLWQIFLFTTWLREVDSGMKTSCLDRGQAEWFNKFVCCYLTSPEAR